ncbi:hypothetical protein CC2G_012273 [Coprinopsis cinerea AmutBmut pab1-1]|nr:hypothetical protein CC2G_012273 [Coprinopsis cinerea AmutBmut pab1-1]
MADISRGPSRDAVLYNEELFHRILDDYRPVGEKSMLISLALACKAFLNPVLDRIWASLPSPFPLLSLLAEFSAANGGHYLTTEKWLTNLDRFLFYSTRVKSITLPAHASAVSSQVYATILTQVKLRYPSIHPFSRTHYVALDTLSEPTLHFLSLVLSPSVTEISLQEDEDVKMAPHVIPPFFTKLKEGAPFLARIRFSGSSHLSNAIRSFARTVELPALVSVQLHVESSFSSVSHETTFAKPEPNLLAHFHAINGSLDKENTTTQDYSVTASFEARPSILEALLHLMQCDRITALDLTIYLFDNSPINESSMPSFITAIIQELSSARRSALKKLTLRFPRGHPYTMDPDLLSNLVNLPFIEDFAYHGYLFSRFNSVAEADNFFKSLLTSSTKTVPLQHLRLDIYNRGDHTFSFQSLLHLREENKSLRTLQLPFDSSLSDLAKLLQNPTTPKANPLRSLQIHDLRKSPLPGEHHHPICTFFNHGFPQLQHIEVDGPDHVDQFHVFLAWDHLERFRKSRRYLALRRR